MVRPNILLVQIRLNLGIRDSRSRATIFGNFHVGSPENGIEHHFTKVVVAPAVMIVRAGEPESTSAVWSVICPGNMLLFAGRYSFAYRRVPAASAVLAA